MGDARTEKRKTSMKNRRDTTTVQSRQTRQTRQPPDPEAPEPRPQPRAIGRCRSARFSGQNRVPNAARTRWIFAGAPLAMGLGACDMYPRSARSQGDLAGLRLVRVWRTLEGAVSGSGV